MKWLGVLLVSLLLLALQVVLPLPWLATAAWVALGWLLVRLSCWLLLEWPAQRGWWREPAKILRDLGQLLLGTALTLVILHQQAGVNLVGLVTTSAVLTAVLGLAAQQTLKDLFAGISLQLDPPFQLGDWIDLGEISGVVESLTLMNTRLRNVEGARIAVPNATVVQTGLRRFRHNDPVGTRLRLGLDYALPPDQAISLIHTVLADHPQVLSLPTPRIWLQDYGDSALVYELLLWHQDARLAVRNQICSEVRTQIWYALARDGWSIPFPVRDIQPRRSRRDRADPSRLNREQCIALLGANPLLTTLQPAQLATLAAGCRVLRYGPGETVIRQGDVGDTLYQVAQGRLAVLLESGEQPVQVLAELGAGDVFGEMGLFAGEPRTATVRALDACRLLEVSRADMAPLLEAEPALVERFAALIEQRRAATHSEANPVERAQGRGAGRLASRIRQLLNQINSTQA
jgi:small-conductance mechanosensitive channel/CRP-like cAMP-binding protein